MSEAPQVFFAAYQDYLGNLVRVLRGIEADLNDPNSLDRAKGKVFTLREAIEAQVEGK